VLPTLPRYFLKRWSYPFLGALFFYGGLILAWEMVVQSRQIFALGAPFQWMIPALLLQVPETLGTVFPMAAVLGGLLGSQHLSEGSEMVASQGMGVGMRSLLWPWFLMSLVLLAVTTLNTHVLVPRVSTLQQAVQTRMVEAAQTRFLKPGSPPFFPPDRPNFAGWFDASGEIHLMESGPQGVQHLVARSMEWTRTEQDGLLSSIGMEFKDLNGTLVQKTDGSIVHIRQKSLTLNVPVPAPSRPLLAATPVRYHSTSELLKHPSLLGLNELGLRFSLPFATCALLLLGIALGLGHPRFQKGGAILKSLGVILVYYLLIEVSKNQIKVGRTGMVAFLLLLPWIFLVLGFLLLRQRLRPHRSAPRFLSRGLSWLKRRTAGRMNPLMRRFYVSLKRALPHPFRFLAWLKGERRDRGTLGRWTRSLWLGNWGATLGTFLTLDLLLEYASLAGELSKNKVSILVFLHYWIWNLPPFLVIVLPLAFLFGGVLTLSAATISREWVALKAGGTSLLQWTLAGIGAWGGVLALSLVLQAMVAPAAIGGTRALYARIRGKAVKIQTAKPWLYMSSTGILWHLDGSSRWGFPLQSQRSGWPILLKWSMREARSEALAWNGLNWTPSLEASRLFPDQALRDVASAEVASTPDLIRWQRWAPDPEKAAMLWSRLLNWMAGPLLLFAVLPWAFPTPRGGRGQALGFSLVAGLLFMGAQAIFGGAAQAGLLPGFWGVGAPLLVLLGFGFTGLRRLRT